MTEESLPQFDRKFFEGGEPFTVIGSSSIGGKARGLAGMRRALAMDLGTGTISRVEVALPRLTVIATEYFDQFLQLNGLRPKKRTMTSRGSFSARAFPCNSWATCRR